MRAITRFKCMECQSLIFTHYKYEKGMKYVDWTCPVCETDNRGKLPDPHCGECGAERQVNDDYCYNCGLKFTLPEDEGNTTTDAEVYICPECKSILKQNANYCHYCGEDVKKSKVMA